MSLANDAKKNNDKQNKYNKHNCENCNAEMKHEYILCWKCKNYLGIPCKFRDRCYTFKCGFWHYGGDDIVDLIDCKRYDENILFKRIKKDCQYNLLGEKCPHMCMLNSQNKHKDKNGYQIYVRDNWITRNHLYYNKHDSKLNPNECIKKHCWICDKIKTYDIPYDKLSRDIDLSSDDIQLLYHAHLVSAAY